MKVNQDGIDLIKFFESCELQAYPDPASALAIELRKPENARVHGWENLSGEPFTIGYGSTGLDEFCDPVESIGPDTEWTQEQAEERFEKDVNLFARRVESLLKVEVSENQFAALVSFAYNCGVSNLKGSTLLQLVNRGKFEAASNEFLKWTKAKGKVLNGLVKRREAERRLFITE